MAYYLDLFSPETFEAFSRSEMTITGFRPRQRGVAKRVQPGDKLICYMTKLSRWVGILEVTSGPFEDDTPIFYEESDPFVVRFHVRPLVWLPAPLSIPIHEDRIWDALSFTHGQSKRTSTWTGKVRSSLVQISEEDGRLLEDALIRQSEVKEPFDFDEVDYQRHMAHRVRGQGKDVSVTVPIESEPEIASAGAIGEVRESIRMQALLARIGSQMGMQIWIPGNDRRAVLAELSDNPPPVLDRLPLNYDTTTMKTIEQIDVIWLKGRSIARAFEVEHTTSIYSGLLRMGDLLALQPNMDIRLHIVAPVERREKVFQEIRRPVFALLERGPLSESCTFISYDSLRELANLPHLTHVAPSVLDEYEEGAEE